MVDRDLLNFIAARLPGTAKGKDRSHLVRREPQLSRALDEAERANVRLGIDPVTARGPTGFIEQPDLFEVSDCLDVNARAARKFADRQTGQEKSVDSVVTTGGT